MCDFGNLEQDIRRLEAAGVGGLHLDVMDGHFVPNLTYGLPLVEAIRRLTDLPLDAHLMISNPSDYVDAFCRAGADVVTVHVEATAEPVALLERIRDLGVGAGIAINPDTPLTAISSSLESCDLVLTMSVQPGFGGQEFNTVALEKIRKLRKLAPPGVLLEIDGGVNDETIGSCAQAGADLFVVGSAIFRHDDYGARVSALSRAAHSSQLVSE